MQAGETVVLKSTGEKVRVLGTTGTGYYQCWLPPQQPWHRPRTQVIREQQLR